MRKNKYNELATILMIIIGVVCILFGIVLQFLLKTNADVLSCTIRYLGKYMIFVGILCSALNIILQIAYISRKNLITNLKSSGKLVYATNLRVWKNYYYGVDKKNWCNLLGDWEDPITHKKYEFKSDKLWIDVEPIINEKNIDKIPVYIDNNNPKIYFVDVDELIPIEPSSKATKTNVVGTIIFTILTVIVISVCVILIWPKLTTTKSINDAQPPSNNEQIPSNDQENDECFPFICYDDLSNIESENLITKANQINEDLRKLLILISLNNFENGEYTLQDLDKYMLHSLIANRLFDTNDYLNLEIGIDSALLSSNDYENMFEQITGIKNVKSYFADYELKNIKDYPSTESLQDDDNYKEYVFIENNDKTYYLVPFGVGLEFGVSVISDITEQADKTLFTIKTYNIDYEADTYIHKKTTTFEIQTNGLRVYSFKTENIAN